ncbi:MAG: pyridoxal-dependent decarboxylase [Myxococcales bacterium]|nr:pyridoxal-dependent decarboxylase [Myxococcales bacterium]
MSDVPAAIRDAYDPERLRADGHRLVDALADQLAAWQRREGVAVPWRPMDEARAAWAGQGLAGGELVGDLMAAARASTALANPRVMGHQVPPPLPSSALAELVSALVNNGMAVAEMGPAAVPIEMVVIQWMCKTLGLPAGAGGVLTSGGSLGNLTALLAMRQAKAGWNVWRDGAHAGPPLAVIVGSDAHYSVARTVRIMGWGDAGVIPAQVDREHRMTAAAVEAALARAGDRRVIGLVAAAGSTATGAFDPLPELADLAAARGLWLHVDAAHGGGLALSAAHRHRLAGIERADSVVWDAHKLLMMPALVTAVLYKAEASSYEAFAQQASYLFAGTQPSDTWWDLGQRTLECTKRAMSFELWAALRVHGEAWFGACVDRQIALTATLARKLAAAGFEVPLAPTANIVCYRHRPPGLTGAALDAHNRMVRQRVVDDGTFYIVGTQLPGGYHLRSTIMNPLIEDRDLDELVAHLQALCR